jgi:hypothetical protein
MRRGFRFYWGRDYEFSRASMEKRWQQGISDARIVLHASPWLEPIPKELGVRVFDVTSVIAACRGPCQCRAI